MLKKRNKSLSFNIAKNNIYNSNHKVCRKYLINLYTTKFVKRRKNFNQLLQLWITNSFPFATKLGARLALKAYCVKEAYSRTVYYNRYKDVELTYR